MSTVIDDQRELAATLIERARLMTDHACDLCYEAAADNATVLNAQQRARIRLYGVHAIHMCRDVPNIM